MSRHARLDDHWTDDKKIVAAAVIVAVLIAALLGVLAAGGPPPADDQPDVTPRDPVLVEADRRQLEMTYMSELVRVAACGAPSAPCETWTLTPVEP